MITNYLANQIDNLHTWKHTWKDNNADSVNNPQPTEVPKLNETEISMQKEWKQFKRTRK